jgi:hypothetical protein
MSESQYKLFKLALKEYLQSPILWKNLPESKFLFYVYLTNLLHGTEAFLRSHQLSSYSRTSPQIMEPKGSLTCSQHPSIGPYPEPYQSNPYHPILILSTHLHLGLPNGLFPSSFPTNTLYAFIFSPFVLHALPISSFLT